MELHCWRWFGAIYKEILSIKVNTARNEVRRGLKHVQTRRLYWIHNDHWHKSFHYLSFIAEQFIRCALALYKRRDILPYSFGIKHFSTLVPRYLFYDSAISSSSSLSSSQPSPSSPSSTLAFVTSSPNSAFKIEISSLA